jgi:hypothetical protein
LPQAGGELVCGCGEKKSIRDTLESHEKMRAKLPCQICQPHTLQFKIERIGKICNLLYVVKINVTNILTANQGSKIPLCPCLTNF